MKRAVVVGSGAGGSTVAKELQGKYQVTVLEAGNSFHPFATDLRIIEKVKKSGLLLDERQIQWLFPAMKISKTADRMVLVRGICYGGTTTLSAGNAVRHDHDLKAIGIDLDAEFEELSREIGVTSDHQRKWHPVTQESYNICQNMGLQPQPTPKMVRSDLCTGCGRCVLGCPHGAKWDARVFLAQAIAKGAETVSGCRVRKVVVERGRSIGVEATRGWRKNFYPADLVILAAGGLGTPIILSNSGVECEPDLFVDPVLCVAARIPESRQNKEIPMPFIVQKENFIISPYFDFLSFFFNKSWKCPSADIFSLMIKLADSNSGGVTARRVTKLLTDKDKNNLKEGVNLCYEVFRRLGISGDRLFLGTINAGHPGGMLPLTENEARTLHNPRLPGNLYVSDASLFPRSLGNPPILTIAAISKRISKLCLEQA